MVQQSVRDRWIGWEGLAAVDRLTQSPSKRTVDWLFGQVDALLAGIYLADLKDENLLSQEDIRHPDPAVLQRLRAEADRAMACHRRSPQKTLHKLASRNDANAGVAWEARARSHLFRSKRCRLLATLLGIRRVFQQCRLHAKDIEDLTEAFQAPPLRAAIAQLIRLIKAERVGINMMDITVCGALAPYNVLLGGKLICLMLCSPEVVRYYARRYQNQPSLIASCMKGAPVCRRQHLVLLCTTSLYGTGSSQYNRVKVPAEVVGGRQGEYLQYSELGYSEGFGSFHLSRETVGTMNVLLARSQDGKRVNSIFGEGVNPLMRKIREALDLLGLPSDAILRHGNRRIVYGVPLAQNFREVLLASGPRISAS